MSLLNKAFNIYKVPHLDKIPAQFLLKKIVLNVEFEYCLSILKYLKILPP